MPRRPHPRYLQIGIRAREHLANHHLRDHHVYEVHQGAARYFRNRRRGSGDYRMIGPDASGRILTIIIVEPDEHGVSRVVTGWMATRAERTLYGR